jgi:hypothetical protein
MRTSESRRRRIRATVHRFRGWRKFDKHEQDTRNMPDCGARIGERHRDGCDIERCPHCGWSALGCSLFDPNDARRQAWNGKWPGEEDCERLDFFVNGDPDFPDLRRSRRCSIDVCVAEVSGLASPDSIA